MQDYEVDGDIDDTTPPGETLALVVEAGDAGRRLDVAMAAAAKAQGFVLSRSRIQALIDGGHLSIGGAPCADSNRKLKVGETIALSVPPAEDPEPQGEPLPLDVVYEDAHLIVIDKPAGLVVHPAVGHATGTLVNALIAHCGASLSGIGGVRRPGIVHRLDKDTSGLLVVAKSDAAHQGLARLFADHGRTLRLTRSYTAFVWGVPDRLFGHVDAPIGRHPTDRLRMAVVSEERGRAAITHWRLQESFGRLTRDGAAQASRITCNLETGRTHQIRVHMAEIGHPVMGDPLYAKGFRSKSVKLAPAAQASLAALRRQALHAAVLGFEHPVTGDYLEFESALPADLLALQVTLSG